MRFCACVINGWYLANKKLTDINYYSSKTCFRCCVYPWLYIYTYIIYIFLYKENSMFESKWEMTYKQVAKKYQFFSFKLVIYTLVAWKWIICILSYFKMTKYHDATQPHMDDEYHLSAINQVSWLLKYKLSRLLQCYRFIERDTPNCDAFYIHC